MSNDELDPAANTQKFQAFMDQPREPESSGSRGVWIAIIVLVVVIVVLLAWLVL
jgi:hypothetical protein